MSFMVHWNTVEKTTTQLCSWPDFNSFRPSVELKPTRATGTHVVQRYLNLSTMAIVVFKTLLVVRNCQWLKCLGITNCFVVQQRWTHTMRERKWEDYGPVWFRGCVKYILLKRPPGELWFSVRFDSVCFSIKSGGLMKLCHAEAEKMQRVWRTFRVSALKWNQIPPMLMERERKTQLPI
jgi:hypothetical protein